MSRWKTGSLFVTAAVGLAAVLFLVQQVGAGGILPGSGDDPLVTKAFVDDYIDSRAESLSSQVEALAANIEEMQATVEKLQAGLHTPVKLTIGSTTAYIGSETRQLEAAPFISQGCTMLPLRFVGEALGATFAYDGTTKTVSFSTGAHNVSLVVGAGSATVDGNQVDLQVPAMLKSGRTLVPLRFVGEALGASVNWDAATKTVTVVP